jgi:hypothetical protein
MSLPAVHQHAARLQMEADELFIGREPSLSIMSGVPADALLGPQCYSHLPILA